MPRCPNCGQETRRTRDWACPWCGYPLVSKSYRALPETYEELREERQRAETPPVAEETPSPAAPHAPEIEPEPEPEFETATETAPEPAPEPEPVAAPEPEPMAESIPELIPRPEVEPVAESEPEAAVAIKPETLPEIKPEPTPKPKPARPKRQRKPALKSKLKPVPEPKAEPVAETIPEPTPQPEPELEVEPVVETVPESPSMAVTLSVEQLYSAFVADAAAADAKYKDRKLRVTGLLYRTVINENLDVAYVILTSAKKHGEWKVSCTFDKKHEGALQRLTDVRTLTVEGKYDSYRANVQMRDCTLPH